MLRTPGSCCHNNWRLCTTAASWSPTCVARLLLSYGSAETPPLRWVTTARTLAGNGQAGEKKASVTCGIGFQHIEQMHEIVRQIHFPFHPFFGVRMQQAELARVQCLTAKMQQGFPQFRADAFG